MVPQLPQKDIQTVTSEGEPIAPLIEGVDIRPAKTLPDERGTICEMYNPAWGVHHDPLVYVYQITIRPNKIKGWIVHRTYDDRLFISLGTVKIVLYDDRADSTTYKMVNEFFIGEHNRALVIIPHGIFHAIQNVGHIDALFVNMPTKPYNHEDPDKYRLPLDTDLIPYRFDDKPGW